MRNSPSTMGRISTVIFLFFLAILVISPTAHASGHPIRHLRNRAPPDSPAAAPSSPSNTASAAPAPTTTHVSIPPPRPTPSAPESPSPNPPKTTTSTTPQATSQPPDTPTSSPTDPTTTSTTPSQPTTTTHISSSTSKTSTSSLLLPTSIVAPIIAPATTFSIPSSTFTPTASISDATPTSQALNKTFWQNKSAVAATFTITSLIILGIFFAAGTMVIRRRSIKRQLRDDYFEKYNENAARGGDISDDVSTHDLTSPALADAYPDRQIHYGQTAPSSHGHDQQDLTDVYAPDEYGISYPPGTAYSTDQEGQYLSGAYSSSQGHYTQSESPFSDPVNHGAGLTPPVAFRDPVGRDQGARDSYQTSIDSFYGAYAR